MLAIDEGLKKQRKQHGLIPIYRLRWCFEFPNNRFVYSGWNCMGNTKQAWSINKTGLLRAIIQGEKIQHYTVHNLLVIPGQEYAGCRWVGGISAGGWAMGSKTMTPVCLGMTMTNSNKSYTVYRDGQLVEAPLSLYEKQFKLREHRSE